MVGFNHGHRYAKVEGSRAGGLRSRSPFSKRSACRSFSRSVQYCSPATTSQPSSTGSRPGCAVPRMKIFHTTNGFTVLVDDEDFERVMEHHWYASHNESGCYSVLCPAKDGLSLASFIMEAPGQTVDHRDRDGFNNQRSNLRFCTRSQNQCNRGLQSNNTSGFKGVRYRADSGKWSAQIRFNGVTKSCGSYPTKEEAIEAYDQAARELHGEFALTNADIATKRNGGVEKQLGNLLQ